MHLIVLYGPPASGKLTIGKILSKRMNYPLLHNHLIVDLASTLFAYGTIEYADFAQELRRRALQAAIQAPLPGLIMTFAYGLETKEGKEDDLVLQKIAALVERSKGSVTFVRLSAEHKILSERVSQPSRGIHKKLTNKRVLKHLLQNYRIEDSIPFAESLSLDTGRLSPLQSARAIMRALGLTSVK